VAQSRKLIKARIKSIRNTRKITKAMELVAASKMRRAVSAVLRTRPYAKEAWATVQSVLAASPNITHPLLNAKPEAAKTLLVLFSSDRGLAGGFNVNMIRAALADTRVLGTDKVEVIGVGRRGADALERAGTTIAARFPALSNNPTFADLLPAARLALEGFLNGKYKKVKLGFTDYISGITQKPKIIDLLPLSPELIDKDKQTTEYLFEPSPAQVLDRILPAIAETMLWQALLESTASEHAARMMAMKSASDAAKDMLETLTFTYNQARQASITQEIAEISGGKAALE
jgi:F-type H+-transporting ATPase subunit gamma